MIINLYIITRIADIVIITIIQYQQIRKLLKWCSSLEKRIIHSLQRTILLIITVQLSVPFQ